MGRGTREGRAASRGAPRRGAGSERAIEAAALLAGLAALGPLLTPGYLWGHDTGAHLFRIAEVARALGEGVLYPRFVPDAYGGLGGPILNFNPVAPYYLPALLVLAGLGPIAALKIAAGAYFLAGGLAVRVLARPHVGRLGAAVAGLAWIYLPYRLANLYVRMAFSELAAMVLLPLALAAARRAVRAPTKRRLAVAVLALGALPAVHFPSSVLGVPLVIVYALASARRGRRAAGGAALAAVVAAALALGAFAWLPALLEQPLTHYEESTAGYDNYRNHFLEAGQLLSPRWGFGASMPGARDGMSFQLGWVHLLALAALAVLAVRRTDLRPLAGLCAAATIGSSLLMLEPSRPVWDLLPILQNVQFPWRWLMVAGIGTSLAAGAIASLPLPRGPDPARGGSRWRASLPAGVVGLLLVAACLPYLQARRGDGSDADFTPAAIRARYFGELKFQPREVATMKFRPEGPRAALPAGGRAAIASERTHRMEVDVEASVPGTLRLHLFHFPGWTARAAGMDLPVRAESGTGLALVQVPAGRHRVELRFGDTPARRWGWLLSAAGLLAAGVLGLPRREKAPRR